MRPEGDVLFLDTERIIFDWRQFAAKMMIPAGLAERADLRVVQEQMFGHFAVQLRTMVLEHTFAEDEYHSDFTYCDSWWQLFKRRFAPGWFLKRWPMTTKTHRFEVKVARSQIYPEANFAPAHFGRPVIHERVKPRAWEVPQ